MSYDIEPIKIQFYTNIESNIVTFSKKMVYHPAVDSSTMSELNEYPYITVNLVYPIERLRIMSYRDRVRFFFIRKDFEEILNGFSPPVIEKTNDEEFYKKQKNAINQNVMTMLELLLPTKFPVINHLYNSLDVVEGKSTGNFSPNAILNAFRPKYFSYLKVNGKVYTINRVVWLNDILNHVVYKELIDGYRRFNIWYRNEQFKSGQSYESSKLSYLKSVIDTINDMLQLLEGYFQYEWVKNNPFRSTFDFKKKGQSSEVTGFYVVMQKIITNYTIIQLSLGKSVDNIKQSLQELFNKQVSDEPIKQKLVEYLLNDVIIPNSTTYNEQTIDEILNKEIGTEKEKVDNNIKPEIIQTGIGYSNGIILLYDGRGTNRTPRITDITSATHIVNDPITVKLETLIKRLKDKIIKMLYSKELDARKNQSLLLPKLKITTYNELVAEYSGNNLTIPDEYRSFIVTLNNFRAPIRQSTNYKLQRMIDCKDESAVVEFFEFMDKLNTQYIDGETNDASKMLTSNEHELLDTGLSQLNTNSTNTTRGEVYVMVDLIDGEINDGNISKIYCPYYGKYLGKEFVSLMRRGKLGKNKLNLWKVDQNRMLFSLDNADSKNIENKPMEIKVKPGSALKQTSKNGDNNLDSLFLMLMNDREYGKRIKDALVKINSANLNDSIQLSENTLLDYIRKNNTELYTAIKDTTKNPQEKNTDLIDKMIRLKNTYKGAEESTDRNIEKNKAILSADKLRSAQFAKEINIVYQLISELLIQAEEAKVEVLRKTGGKRRTRRMKIRRSRTGSRRR
jgi:hypothetical protein